MLEQMLVMKRKPAKKILLSIAVIIGAFYTNQASASTLSFTASIQNESFTSDANQDVSRLALGALGAEFEMNLNHKLSAGVFGGAQTSAVSQENLSFGLGGFINYYFKGSPIKSTFTSSSAYITGLERISYFAGLGIEQRFLQSSELDSEIRGGPFVRFGGRYVWNQNMFFTANIKYLLAGEDYSSIDLVFGLGFYL